MICKLFISRETSSIMKAFIAKSWSLLGWYGAVGLINISIFVTSWSRDYALSAAMIFSTMGWIEIMRSTVFGFTDTMVEDNINMFVSVARIQVQKAKAAIC